MLQKSTFSIPGATKNFYASLGPIQFTPIEQMSGNSKNNVSKRTPRDLYCTPDGIGRPLGSKRCLDSNIPPPANIIHPFCSTTPVLSTPPTSMYLRSNNGNFVQTTPMKLKDSGICELHGESCAGHQHHRSLPYPNIVTSVSVGKLVSCENGPVMRCNDQMETKKAMMGKTGFVRKKIKGKTRGVQRATAIPGKKMREMGVPILQWFRSKQNCYTDNGITIRAYGVNLSSVDLSFKSVFVLATREPMLGIKSAVSQIAKFKRGDAITISPMLMAKFLKGDFDGDELSFMPILNEVCYFEMEHRLYKQCHALRLKINDGEFNSKQIVFHKGKYYSSLVYDHEDNTFDPNSKDSEEIKPIESYGKKDKKEVLKLSKDKVVKNIIKNKLTSATGYYTRTISELLTCFRVTNGVSMNLSLRGGVQKVDMESLSDFREHHLTRIVFNIISLVMEESLKVKIISKRNSDLMRINPIGEMIGFGEQSHTIGYLCSCREPIYYKCACWLKKGALLTIPLNKKPYKSFVRYVFEKKPLDKVVSYNLKILSYQYSRIIRGTEAEPNASILKRKKMTKSRKNMIKEFRVRIWMSISLLGKCLGIQLDYEGCNELEAAMYLLSKNGYCSLSDSKLKNDLEWGKRMFSMNYEKPFPDELDSEMDLNDLDSFMNRQGDSNDGCYSSYYAMTSERD